MADIGTVILEIWILVYQMILQDHVIKRPCDFTWCRSVVIITTAQLHSTKPELRFCAGSNPTRSMSEMIHDGENL